MVDFSKNLYVEEFNFREVADLRPEGPGDIPTSDQISGIEVRLSRGYIKDNKTKPVFPFPGLAKVYFINLVVSDVSPADIDISLEGFEKVGDGHNLAVDRTLFYWKKTANTARVPSQIHLMSSLIKSKQDLREAAEIMSKAQEDTRYRSLTESLGGILRGGADGNVSKIVLNIAGIIGGYLGKVDDKPLLTRFQSFTDLGGDFNQLGQKEHPFENNYAIMNYSIYIRDAIRQKEAEARIPVAAAAGR